MDKYPVGNSHYAGCLMLFIWKKNTYRQQLYLTNYNAVFSLKNHYYMHNGLICPPF